VGCAYDGDRNLSYIASVGLYKESRYVRGDETFSYPNELLIPSDFEISLSKDGINYEVKEEITKCFIMLPIFLTVYIM